MVEMVYGSEELLPRVKSVLPLPGSRLRLTFTNGEERLFDATPLLKYPAFRRLNDEDFFRLVTVQYGTICWPGDINYCPDTLYMQSTALH